MDFFNDNLPNVSTSEFHDHIIGHLVGLGWTQHDREKVKMVFEPMMSDQGKLRGITQTELERGLLTLKQYHAITDPRLLELKNIMNKYINK